MKNIYTGELLTEKAKLLFKEERKINHLEGWFLSREIAYNTTNGKNLSEEEKAAEEILAISQQLPLSISENNVFVGTQRDAFARSYALINPAFQVEKFNGYCDPTAVYGDIDPTPEFTKERIVKMRALTEQGTYCKELSEAYKNAERETAEVLYFMEQVTGHLIPDFRPVLKYGIAKIKQNTEKRIAEEKDEDKKSNLKSMVKSLDAVLILAERYKKIAEDQLTSASEKRKEELKLIISTLSRVPMNPCENLFDAIQSFILVWQVMCLEQAPNPFAFSVGNADRIFEPYRAKTNMSREVAAGLFKHLLVFFNVGDRSWAISQSLLIGGKDTSDNDLTNLCSYALLDAYYDMNLPQPILSVKLHKNTPNELYRELGKFWFTPGMLTPSLFNDDSLFPVLKAHGVDEEDLSDYSIAGCQEPLIMGKDNGNTTNSWLNLAKVLEVTLTGGYSLVTDKKLFDTENSAVTVAKDGLYEEVKKQFFDNLDKVMDKMVASANSESKALSHLRVPFLSSFMYGLESGYDLRDYYHQGTKYNGSGCLVHGLSVVADSLLALKSLSEQSPELIPEIIPALKDDWKGHEELLKKVKSYDKFGNACKEVDLLASEIAERVSKMLKSKKNYLGNPFRPDFSSPSTHLLYGYWTGASLDGRNSRQMLNYGVDPLFGEAQNGLGLRLASQYLLPYKEFNGGFASHLGIDPRKFKSESFEDKGDEFYQKIIKTLFFNENIKGIAPFYVYFNITTAETLRKVLAHPEIYAPSGVYIMRIHGTFVNFLDLSPDIQKDIITRLDQKSTTIEC